MHADPRCVASCRVMATIVALLLQGMDKNAMDTESGVTELQSNFTMGRTTCSTDLELDEVRTIGYTYKCLSAGL
jgi:ADP-ribosylglycohydrolase